MPGAATLRDSTQIVLPADRLGAQLRDRVRQEFTVTVTEETAGETPATRMIGSPVEIKRLSEFLTRHGISVP